MRTAARDPMIYSASRRTDLVAFHPDALAARIGRARKLDAVVFWTKDPTALTDHPGLERIIARVPTLVQMTITGWGGTCWEPGVPAPERLAEPLSRLARRLPPGALRWRFDPLVLDIDPRDNDGSPPNDKALPDTADDAFLSGPERKTAARLVERFRRIHALWTRSVGAVDDITTSFMAMYPGTRDALARRGLAVRSPGPDARRAWLSMLHRAWGHPEGVFSICCQPELLSLPFTHPARCIDAERLDRLYGTRLSNLPRDAGQRAACACAQSTDIGAYTQRCGHGCAYCYARHAGDADAFGQEGGCRGGRERYTGSSEGQGGLSFS